MLWRWYEFYEATIMNSTYDVVMNFTYMTIIDFIVPATIKL